MNIKEIREKNNLSQVELASRLGITKSAICSWEKGRYEPTAKNLKKLSKALDCTVDDLIREDKPNVK